MQMTWQMGNDTSIGGQPLTSEETTSSLSFEEVACALLLDEDQ